MKISALDDNGKPVDWWFAYKIPKLAKSATDDAAVGYEYVYYDTNVGKVVKSPNLLTDGKGALDLTLKSIFESKDDTTGWILYNDEKPVSLKEKDNPACGHTKGFLAFDTATKTALWLLHSWPKFAEADNAPMPTPKFGQTYLCISLDMATVSKIAAQMANHQEPQVYMPKIPASLSKTDPLFLLTQTLNPNAPGDSNVLECTSRGGLAFKVIAKNRKWGKDFWDDLVGPTLKADMDVETWIRGGQITTTVDSDGVHKTVDVKFIDFSPLGVPYFWSESHDHAKWGITTDSDWVCVGDMNRMISQEKRGGATIAFQDKVLWTALSKTDLIIPPPGHTVEHVKKMIKATHAKTDQPPAMEKPVAKKTVTKNKAVSKKAAPKKKAAVKKAVPKKKVAAKKAIPGKKPATKKKATAKKAIPKKKATVKKTTKKKVVKKAAKKKAAKKAPSKAARKR
jgi:deoxyribonuclease-2